MVDVVKIASEMVEECGYESPPEGPDPDAESTHTDLDDADDVENVDTRPKVAAEFVFKSLAYLGVKDILRVVVASFLQTGGLISELLDALNRGYTVEQILQAIQTTGEGGQSLADQSIPEVLKELSKACRAMAKTEVLDEYDWEGAAEVIDEMTGPEDPVQAAKLIESKLPNLPSLDESEIAPEDVD